jgi:hypothetical protein
MGAFSPGPPINTFVVRFWREWSVAGPRWRGQIDHVQSGASARFLDLEEMLDVIQSFGVMAGVARQPDDINRYSKPVPRAEHPSDAEDEVRTDKDGDQHKPPCV